MAGAEPLAGHARRVLVAEDHPLYREALRAVLPQAFPGADIDEACAADEALACATSGVAYDLVLLDLNLPGATGVSCLRRVRALLPRTPIAVVSAVDDPNIMGEVVMAGAMAYVPKSAPRQVLVDAIKVILAGGTYLPAEAIAALREAQAAPQAASEASPDGLTQRQRRVLTLLAEGRSNKHIARELGISEVTVKAHVSSILRKLGLNNRVQAAIEARAWLARHPES